MQSKVFSEVGHTTHVRIRLGGTAAHINLRPCVVFCREAPISVEYDGRKLNSHAILVPANRVHKVDFHNNQADVIYFGPGFDPAADFNALAGAAIDLLADEIDRWSVQSATELFDIFGCSAGNEDSLIKQVCAGIELDPISRMSATQISYAMALERTAFLKRFKRETKMTFSTYKNWVALKYAIGLIIEGSEMGLAGLDSGFADAAHFSRRFKNVFGLTPKEASVAARRTGPKDTTSQAP
jgi:AraC-like DNA-binding protein